MRIMDVGIFFERGIPNKSTIEYAISKQICLPFRLNNCESISKQPINIYGDDQKKEYGLWMCDIASEKVEQRELLMAFPTQISIPDPRNLDRRNQSFLAYNIMIALIALGGTLTNISTSDIPDWAYLRWDNFGVPEFARLNTIPPASAGLSC